MPFIYVAFQTREHQPLVGNGDCVTLIQTLTPGLIGVHTSAWRKGRDVVGSTGIVPGTAIATFENGRYPTRAGSKHAAFFLAYGGSGFWVVDQWKDKEGGKVERRYIHPAPPGKTGVYAAPSNSAGAFSVIELR